MNETKMHTARDGRDYEILYSIVGRWEGRIIVFGLPDCGSYEFAVFNEDGERIAESDAGYGSASAALLDALLLEETGKVREGNLCKPFALVDAEWVWQRAGTSRTQVSNPVANKRGR